MKSRGFTLIELLVVIAIIGILSSVVLASLNSARNKGGNAKVKEQLVQARTAAEIFYQDHYNVTGQNTYNPSGGTVTSCSIGIFVDPSSGMIKYTSQSSYPSFPSGMSIVCIATDQTYAIAVPLTVAENGKTYWCVDSTGASKSISTPPSSSSVHC